MTIEEAIEWDRQLTLEKAIARHCGDYRDEDFPEDVESESEVGGGGGFETVATPRATTATTEDQPSGPRALGAVPPISGLTEQKQY